MKNTLETRLGIFFAIALIAAFVLMELLGSLDFFKPGIKLRARFANVQELAVGDPVKVAGVVVGRVESIEFVEDKAEVIMKVLQPDRIHTDSQATIRFAGLMGQNYVSITFGSPTAPAAGDRFLLQTTEQPDLGVLMGRLDDVASGIKSVTDSLSGDSIQNVLGPLTDFLKENNPRFTAILANTQTIFSQIAKGEGTLGKVVIDTALYDTALTAVSNLNTTATGLQSTLSKAQTIVDRLNAGEGTLGKLTQDPALFNETTTAMTNLREVLQKINQGRGSVGKLVNDDAFYQNIKLSLQKLDKATESLEDQGPLTVLGIAVGRLF